MKKDNSKIISKLFFNMLPVQILIFAMGSINSIVDGTMAGRFIDSSAVAVIGLHYSMVQLLAAICSVILGGTTVLCGRYMGKGDIEKTDGVFSLNITVSAVVGIVITVINLAFPSSIATILGSNEELKSDLVTYIIGYAFGIIPMMLAQQLAYFLQMERQNAIGYIGIAGMTITNVVMDIVLVGVLRMGIWGLALATTFSSLLYFLILVPYYFTSRAQLHYNFKNARWEDFWNMIKIGFPGALLVICLSVRGVTINKLLLHIAGEDGLSAMSAYNMINGFLIAYCLGNGSVMRMLISVFAGEEDKYSMRDTLKLVLTKGVAISVVFAGIILAISPYISSIFFADNTSAAYRMNHQLLVINTLCIPLILLCQISTNYFQALDHRIFVNVESVFDGFFAMVIPAFILAPFMGVLGIWLANPIGIVLTLLLTPIYGIIFWKHIPKNVDEWMFLKPGFGISKENIINLTVRDMEDVATSSARIQEFCGNNGMGKKLSYYAALCFEEMAGNVIRHGFSADSKRHSVEAKVFFSDEWVTLRIKDDCIPFDPGEMAEIIAEDNPNGSIGIRMVYSIADDVTYQQMLGLNILTIKLRGTNIILDARDDYLMEKTLRALNPDLHKRFKDTAFVVQRILSKYRLLFSEYTDHSELHSMTVIDSCNRLIGTNQINKLNADEIYILLTGCYLHDVGMGIGDKDYEEFGQRLGADEFFAKNPDATKADFVRTCHNELSGLFVEKYGDLFDIPSPAHLFAIKQVVRGHRKTNLFDEKEYPSKLILPNGNTVCLPYISALLRISDEIDVVATRNPLVLYDLDELTDEIEIVENKKVAAIKSMYMTESAFVLLYDTEEQSIIDELEKMVEKMQSTLDYCRDVVKKRTDFTLRQRRVILRACDK